jgi:hypothetical protein
MQNPQELENRPELFELVEPVPLLYQPIEHSSRKSTKLFYTTKRTLNKPSHNLTINTDENPFAAAAFARYCLFTHHFLPRPAGL